jgi:glutathione peroxidase
MTSIYSFSAGTLQGDTLELSRYRGHVLLVVNVASKCGFTPQYQGLQTLHEKYRDRQFAVLGFPCDQFGHQEPGDSAQISAFCSTNYGVTFPLLEKIEVNGPQTHPLYKWLKSQKRGILGTQRIKWNFTKFLVNRKGEVVKRYGSTVRPEALQRDIELELAQPHPAHGSLDPIL